ncbi:hypothetical protein Tco_1485763 [Tanacetum coccineum]
MALTILVITLFFLAVLVSSKVTLQNPSFETPPTNLTTNATSQFMLLDSKINVIPGWSYKGTVWYVTSGGNISLPGNGHGLQLGPNGMINQTFKSYDSYDCVLTFTIAPSSAECANNYTAVNVSAPGVSKVFFYDESLGTEMWQTYAFSVGGDEIKRGFFGVKIQSVVATTSHSNVTCWPIVDALLVKAIGPQTWYTDNPILNNGFEVGPAFMGNSSQGILLEAGSNRQPSVPLQGWTILGILKYIDSKHFAVPEGRGAIELISGNPSGIATNTYFYRQGQFTLEFIMGDANDSCVGDFVVYLQVGNTIWNFTTRSIGVGSSEKHSVTFMAEFSHDEPVPISFYSFNETRTSDQQVLCGPVIDGTNVRYSSGIRSKKLHIIFMVLSIVATMTKSTIQEYSGANNEDMDPTVVATLRKTAVEKRSCANNEDMDHMVDTMTKSAVQERASANNEDMDPTVATVTKSSVQERSAAHDEDVDPTVATVTKSAVQECWPFSHGSLINDIPKQ